MRLDLQKGQYTVRLATDTADVRACQELRHLCFFRRAGIDADVYDDCWQHLMVTDRTGTLVATLRLSIATGPAVLAGYAARHYDLRGLGALRAPILEVGRFCVRPGYPDPHIARVVWGGVTRIVDTTGCRLLFGCTSFAGTDPAPYSEAFSWLARGHLAPARFGSLRREGEHVDFAAMAAAKGPQSPLPPLLRSYLAMGGWVSDHAVVDHAMNTLHVLTGLEVDRVPPARAKALRALA